MYQKTWRQLTDRTEQEILREIERLKAEFKREGIEDMMYED